MQSPYLLLINHHPSPFLHAPPQTITSSIYPISEHLQRADPFRTAKTSKSVRLDRALDRKGLPSGLGPFGLGGAPSGATHFLGEASETDFLDGTAIFWAKPLRHIVHT
jgi:hypothetical protein